MDTHNPNRCWLWGHISTDAVNSECWWWAKTLPHAHGSRAKPKTDLRSESDVHSKVLPNYSPVVWVHVVPRHWTTLLIIYTIVHMKINSTWTCTIVLFVFKSEATQQLVANMSVKVAPRQPTATLNHIRVTVRFLRDWLAEPCVIILHTTSDSYYHVSNQWCKWLQTLCT